jgi:hypothetical protein
VLAGLWATLGLSCGYRSSYAHPPAARLSVQIGQLLVPGASAAQSAMSGARAELAASGLLAGGTEFPRLVIDLLRTDEVSRGVYVRSGQAYAAGMGVAVTVRGRVFVADKPDPI